MQKEKALTFQLLLEKSELVSGRSGEIRTRGLLNPIQARYQAALHPDERTFRQAKYIIPRRQNLSRGKSRKIRVLLLPFVCAASSAFFPRVSSVFRFFWFSFLPAYGILDEKEVIPCESKHHQLQSRAQTPALCHQRSDEVHRLRAGRRLSADAHLADGGLPALFGHHALPQCAAARADLANRDLCLRAAEQLAALHPLRALLLLYDWHGA